MDALDVGWRHELGDRGTSLGFGASIGHLAEARLTSITVDVGSGSRNRSFSVRHGLVPAGVLDLVAPIGPVRFVVRSRVGAEIGLAHHDAAWVELGAGIRLPLGTP